MDYQLYWPSAPLRPYVQFYGLLSVSAISERPLSDRVPPYLGKGLIFSLEEEPAVHVANSNFDRLAPTGYFLPQCTQGFQLRFTKSAQLLAVIFRPGKFRHIFHLPAREMVDNQVVSFDEADLRPLKILQEKLLEPASIRHKLRLIEVLLMQQFAKAEFQLGLTDQTLQLLSSNQAFSLHSLAQGLNISTRYLRRKFTEDIGIPPKVFLRIRRFNWAFQAMQSGQFNKLTDVAYQFHYFDQSHFTQEFKRFMGLSPKQFLGKDDLLQHQLHWRD